MTLPSRAICPGYRLNLAKEDSGLLGFAPDFIPAIGEHVLCLAILSTDESRETTANLLAPLVVNMENHEAVQAIQFDSDWTCDHPLPRAASC